MFGCPFLEDHPDLFLLLVALLMLVYFVVYGLYCLILHLLYVSQRNQGLFVLPFEFVVASA
jgi:hypothetical protein